MKTLKNLFTTILVLFSMSSFAQRYTHWEGTYVMDYGNQTMRIKSTGGNYYKAFFTGNCNARTVEGEVDNGELIFPLVGGRSGDMILISREGNKLSVDVRGKEVMRRSCGGNSIIGLYSSRGNHSNYYYNDNENHNKYDRYHEIQYEREYGSSVKVNDLLGWSALDAYGELEARGFREVKHFSSSGKTYRVWYNHSTNQCIKTLSQNKKISQVMRSTHCN